MGLLSNKRWLGGAAAVIGAWLVLGACNGTPVAVVDDDAGNPEGGGGDATSEAGGDAAAESGTHQDASMDAPVADAPIEASSDAMNDAMGDAAIDSPSDVAPEAPSDASVDSPLEAAPCTFAGTWGMTVQTITAAPTLTSRASPGRGRLLRLDARWGAMVDDGALVELPRSLFECGEDDGVAAHGASSDGTF